MSRWDEFLSHQDRAQMERAGFGGRGELGGRPALLVVDVTYEFAGDPVIGPEQSKERWRLSCPDQAATAVPAIEELLSSARRGGVPVLYTKPALPMPGGRNKGRWLDKSSGETSRVLDQMSHAVVAAINPRDDDFVIEKEKPSAFFGTPLMAFLVDLQVDTVVVCGATTSGCVRASVVDAFSYNLRVAVVEDAVFDRVEASHWIGLFDMAQKYAEVVPLADACSYLARPRRTVGPA